MIEEPEYSQYSLLELEETARLIDKESYPERFGKIQELIAKKQSELPETPASIETEIEANGFFISWFRNSLKYDLGWLLASCTLVDLSGYGHTPRIGAVLILLNIFSIIPTLAIISLYHMFVPAGRRITAAIVLLGLLLYLINLIINEDVLDWIIFSISSVPLFVVSFIYCFNKPYYSNN